VAGNDWQHSVYLAHWWSKRWLPGMGYHQMATDYHQMAMDFLRATDYHQMVTAKGFRPKHILYPLL
jgi:hypothetical protein